MWLQIIIYKSKFVDKVFSAKKINWLRRLWLISYQSRLKKLLCDGVLFGVPKVLVPYLFQDEDLNISFMLAL